MDSAKLVVSVLGNFILWNEMLILWVTWRSFHNFYCKLFASIRCRKWWQHTKLGLVTQKVIRDKEDSFCQSSRIILKIQNALHFCSLLLKIELVEFPSRCQLAVIIWKSKIIISLIDAPIEMKDLNPIFLRDMYISSVYQSLFSLNYEVYGCFNHTFLRHSQVCRINYLFLSKQLFNIAKRSRVKFANWFWSRASTSLLMTSGSESRPGGEIGTLLAEKVKVK